MVKENLAGKKPAGAPKQTRRRTVTTRAYILIETGVGKTRDVLESIRALPNMTSVDAVTGPYDIIAVAEAGDLNAIGDIVTSRVHRIPGISRTVTCLAVDVG